MRVRKHLTQLCAGLLSPRRPTTHKVAADAAAAAAVGKKYCTQE